MRAIEINEQKSLLPQFVVANPPARFSYDLRTKRQTFLGDRLSEEILLIHISVMYIM